jgi:hypothetical protein
VELTLLIDNSEFPSKANMAASQNRAVASFNSFWGNLGHSTRAIVTISFGGSEIQKYFGSVLPKLREFANANPEMNGWIKECYLIKQVFFAATVSGTVHTAGAIDGKAAFAEAGVQAGGDLALSWSHDQTTFVGQGSKQIPFAVRGDPVD